MAPQSWLHPMVSIAVAAAVGGGCALVLDPERLDSVDRCRFDQDCPVPDDPRYELICTFSDDETEEPDYPKICSPRPSVSCDSAKFDYDSEFATRIREARALPNRYDEACMDQVAVAGCVPGDHGCATGLSSHPESGRCDDRDESTPPAVSPVPSVREQDVLDQFCHSVFCDERYVCDKRSDSCVPCTLGRPVGRGGCGDLYIDGVRSTVYLDPDELEANCLGADGSFEDAQFGPI